MKTVRRFLRRGKAFPFLRFQMNDATLTVILRFPQKFFNRLFVVSVGRTEIIEPEVFKNITSVNRRFHTSFQTEQSVENTATDPRDSLKKRTDHVLGFDVTTR